ncbi:hypothetical protein GGQ86_003681 [Xanthobacter flavus]|uniref:Uncharacterized protein n=2 Tax=Hyphomicrobiales TaxID=356 RepID=A0A7W9L2P5_9HYPH|nr:hypothetical protein [Prosthecomicrobium pneumaticum]MDR6335191.1 hypothetical protein [Xanthobacter flavus]
MDERSESIRKALPISGIVAMYVDSTAFAPIH